MALLILYLAPILALDGAWFSTDQFRLSPDDPAGLVQFVSTDPLNLAGVPRFLAGLFAMMGVSLAFAKHRQKTSAGPAPWLGFFIVLLLIGAAALSLLTYYAYVSHRTAIAHYVKDVDIDKLIGTAGASFKELLGLIGAAVGVKLAEGQK